MIGTQDDKAGAPGLLPMRVRALGYGGLIPFLALSAALWWGPKEYHAFVRLALLAYGATIASFLGAIHWGLAMLDARPGRSMLPYVWGVLPSLVAWAALLAPLNAGLLVMAALLWACLAVDWIAYRNYGLAHWLTMRFVLTLLASASCVLGALA